MSLSFVLAGSQIKRFRSSLRSLAAIGEALNLLGWHLAGERNSNVLIDSKLLQVPSCW